jgi:uncharacterized protein (TIGR02246 family)
MDPMNTGAKTLVLGLMCCAMAGIGRVAHAQPKTDDAELRRLPHAFSDAFNKHDAHQLAGIMTNDVDFVTVGLTWLVGRADFEKYHGRLFADRFKDISYRVLETHVRMKRPDLAVVRHSWSIEGDRNVDGTARPPRFGMMTMLAEKTDGTWLVSAVQNVNAPTGERPAITPESEGITSPIRVPRVGR